MKNNIRNRVFVLFSALALLIMGCGASPKTVKRMQILEEGVTNPTTPKEIEDAIRKYGTRIEDILLAQEQVGIWYKLLGTRYLDSKMYNEALKAFQKAIEFYPENGNLYYYVGICAGYMAQSALDYAASGSTAQKYNYLKLSEAAYLRALEIEPRYVRALYALSVLYVFELDDSAKAVPLLEKLLTIDTKHIDAMFVLARAYYSMYQVDKAVAIYDRIIEIAPRERKDDAEANKRQALEGYGRS
ncbi:MAG: tetratricopeptide repeat protein [Spirochaetaceae bacterium]|jgi:tetratricopeptide (TPR) repeat protein|nr:tetratricopeptide repeat protein [Spirochaetaceae bacterium]